MLGEQECFFQCPYCASSISMLIEVCMGSQSYIEDCEVCCRPIALTYQVDAEDLVVTSLVAKRLDD